MLNIQSITHVFLQIKKKNFGNECRSRIILFVPQIRDPRFHISFPTTVWSLVMLVFFTMVEDPQGPWAPNYRGFFITFKPTTFSMTPLDE
jgi:hypothetical protein